VPVSNDVRLPAIDTSLLIRENRLYQADWFSDFMALKPMKFFENNPFLDLEVDPKCWALRNITHFQ
jgi:predicted DNA-binding helix-hairpin-helix protein